MKAELHLCFVALVLINGSVQPVDAADKHKGITVAIGLNEVDPKHYGSSMPLKGPEQDAKDIIQITAPRGFQGKLLLSKQATRSAVQAAIRDAARHLAKDDVLVLSFSGHGGEVPDKNDDEADKLDETWCLYDGQLLDDELYALWAEFPEGVRILVTSDSCNSGTVIKATEFMDVLDEDKRKDLTERFESFMGPQKSSVAVKSPPLFDLIETYRRNADAYDAIQAQFSSGDKASIRATVLLISAAMDGTPARDGSPNSLFTAQLLRTWAKGDFSGSHPEFHQAIRSGIQNWQVPNYFKVGTPNQAFEDHQPLTITK